MSNTICGVFINEPSASVPAFALQYFDYDQITPKYARKLRQFRHQYLPNSSAPRTMAGPIDKAEAHWLIFRDSQLVAAVSLNRVLPSLGQLRQLIVHPNYQRQNLGQRLVSYVEQHLTQQTAVVCDCSSHCLITNSPRYCLLHARPSAALFYRCLGYQPLAISQAGLHWQESTINQMLKPGLDHRICYQWLAKPLTACNPVAPIDVLLKTTASADYTSQHCRRQDGRNNSSEFYRLSTTR